MSALGQLDERTLCVSSQRPFNEATPYKLAPAPNVADDSQSAASTVKPPADPPWIAMRFGSARPSLTTAFAHAIASCTSTMPLSDQLDRLPSRTSCLRADHGKRDLAR